MHFPRDNTTYCESMDISRQYEHIATYGHIAIIWAYPIVWPRIMLNGTQNEITVVTMAWVIGFGHQHLNLQWTKAFFLGIVVRSLSFFIQFAVNLCWLSICRWICMVLKNGRFRKAQCVFLYSLWRYMYAYCFRTLRRSHVNLVVHQHLDPR